MNKTSAPDYEGGPPRRTAFFDISFPNTREMFRQLGGFAVLAVRYFSVEMRDLPLDRAYLVDQESSPARILTLEPIGRSGRHTVLPMGHLVAKRFGSFVQEAYFLLPIPMLSKQGEIGIETFGKAEHLRLAALPTPVPESLQGLRAPSGATPDPGLLLAILTRDFCFRPDAIHGL
ncbi:MAG: hypothetical protein IT285_03300 [Bdellovibrionales bacterium]|nr:hypothetical protein [Bdellovibrionales bacterium]